MYENSSLPIITIRLQRLRYFAYHGLYEAEKKNGNKFELDVKISFRQTSEIIQNLNETIDYAAVDALIKKEMQIPRELLETLLGELAEKLKLLYPQIIKIELSLNKLTAPIPDFTGRVGVEFLKEYFI